MIKGIAWFVWLHLVLLFYATAIGVIVYTVLAILFNENPFR